MGEPLGSRQRIGDCAPSKFAAASYSLKGVCHDENDDWLRDCDFGLGLGLLEQH